jgi:hypothetical protein
MSMRGSRYSIEPSQVPAAPAGGGDGLRFDARGFCAEWLLPSCCEVFCPADVWFCGLLLKFGVMVFLSFFWFGFCHY